MSFINGNETHKRRLSLNPPGRSLHHFLHGSSTFHHKYLYNWISMQQSKARLDVPARCGNVASSQTKSAVVSDQMAMMDEAGPLLNTWLYAVTQTKGKVAILVVIVVSKGESPTFKKMSSDENNKPPACLILHKQLPASHVIFLCTRCWELPFGG